MATAGHLGRHGSAKPEIGDLTLARDESDEHSFEISGEYHILAIVLQPSQLSLQLGPKLFPHQKIVPGIIQITPPGLPARAVYSQPYDTLHFHIPNVLLMECFASSHGKWPWDGVALRDPLPLGTRRCRNSERH